MVCPSRKASKQPTAEVFLPKMRSAKQKMFMQEEDVSQKARPHCLKTCTSLQVSSTKTNLDVSPRRQHQTFAGRLELGARAVDCVLVDVCSWARRCTSKRADPSCCTTLSTSFLPTWVLLGCESIYRRRVSVASTCLGSELVAWRSTSQDQGAMVSERVI